MGKKKRMYNISKQKTKSNMIVAGGYISSLEGITQTERAELYKLNRRGAGVYKNKKRKALSRKKNRSSKHLCYDEPVFVVSML